MQPNPVERRWVGFGQGRLGIVSFDSLAVGDEQAGPSRTAGNSAESNFGSVGKRDPPQRSGLLKQRTRTQG